MDRWWTRGLALLLALPALLLVAAASAEEPGGPAPETRLYTNADLDQLGPPPAEPSRPVAQPDPAGWDEVIAFIEREHEKIAARRASEESRGEVVVIPQRRSTTWGLGYGLGGYVPVRPGYRRDGRPRFGAGPGRVSYYENHGIRPIHAGPSKTMQMRAAAIAGAAR